MDLLLWNENIMLYSQMNVLLVHWRSDVLNIISQVCTSPLCKLETPQSKHVSCFTLPFGFFGHMNMVFKILWACRRELHAAHTPHFAHLCIKDWNICILDVPYNTPHFGIIKTYKYYHLYSNNELLFCKPLLSNPPAP